MASPSWFKRNNINRRRWGAARMQALVRDGWRCRGCGRFAHEVDHTTPVSRGGDRYNLSNLQTLCGGRGGCHAKKTARENGSVPLPGQAEWAALVDALRE